MPAHLRPLKPAGQQRYPQRGIELSMEKETLRTVGTR